MFLVSCSDRVDFSTPAQQHINDYRAKLKQCKETDRTPVASTSIPPRAEVLGNPSDVFAVNEHDIVLGNPDAKVVVIEYSSPTCTHCAYFHKAIFPELQKNYIDTGKVAYVIREFIANKQDLDATILALCGKKENFVKMLDIFFKKQESWAFNTNYRDILTNIGQLSGVTPEEYASCLADSDLLERVIGQSRAVTHVPKFIGTPSFAINGELYNKAYTYENLSGAIEEAMSSASSVKVDESPIPASTTVNSSSE